MKRSIGSSGLWTSNTASTTMSASWSAREPCSFVRRDVRATQLSNSRSPGPAGSLKVSKNLSAAFLAMSYPCDKQQSCQDQKMYVRNRPCNTLLLFRFVNISCARTTSEQLAIPGPAGSLKVNNLAPLRQCPAPDKDYIMTKTFFVNFWSRYRCTAHEGNSNVTPPPPEP
jgi:hypothetical protein